MKNVYASLIPLLIFAWFIPHQLRAQSFQEIMEAKQARVASHTVLDQALVLTLGHYQVRNGLPLTPLVAEAELSLDFRGEELLYDAAGRIAVQLRCQSIDGLRDHLQPLGFVESARTERFGLLEGYLPVDQVGRLDELATNGLLSASAIFRPVNNTGSVTSQADTTLQAYRVRNLAPDNIDGSGVKIGVLSDSYDNLGGAAAGVTSMDLPADVRNLADLGSGGSDEGRAMIELVHDLAPGATKYFATAFGGQSGFATNIQLLADSGCTVIVDDIVYFEEPFFQDGIIAQAVADVTTNQDVIYFSSAGNRSDRAFETTTPSFSADPFQAQNSLDFDPGAGTDHFQSFTLDNGQSLRLALQWDDPFYTGAGVDTDLDIVILQNPPSTTTVLAAGSDDNLANQTPSEFVSYTNNTGATETVHVWIIKFAGPDPTRVKYVNFGTHSPDEWATNSPTVNPHAGATECVAVAAAPFYVRSPESFTSQGPSTFLFDETGTPLGAPEVRNKPDFTATDAANTTFFGSDTNADPDAFPNFFGTSAAAPQAAAIAALARQAYPAENRDAIYNRLFTNAEDMDSPGFDFVTGNGLINGFRTLYPITPAALPYNDGMENGSLGAEWEFAHTNNGRIRIFDSQSPASGSLHLGMDTWVGLTGISGLNEAILHFDATNATAITLSFDQKESGDEENAMSAVFVGSENSDGVAISVDGTNWFSLLSLTGANSTNAYQNNLIDISTFATTNGLTLGSDVMIKFQQYDNFPFPDDGMTFDNFGITATIFPVELVNFEGEWTSAGEARLNWITASEQNSDHYRLERSPDAIHYREIGTVAARGNSVDTATYSFLDRTPNPGDNYYRLWQVDVDGTEHVSNTILLTGESAGPRVIMSPNPVEGQELRLAFSGMTASSDPAEITLSDLRGRTLHREAQVINADVLTLQIPDLAPGMYMLTIRHEQLERSIRLIKS